MFPPPIETKDAVFPSNNVYAVYLLLNPKWQDCFLSSWDWFRNTDTELNLQHAYIRCNPMTDDVCPQMNSSKAFFPTENANKYWFVGHWQTQVLQFILEKLVPSFYDHQPLDLIFVLGSPLQFEIPGSINDLLKNETTVCQYVIQMFSYWIILSSKNFTP